MDKYCAGIKGLTLDPRSWSVEHKLMNLSDLLKTHERYTTRSALSGNLGDGYLLKHNPIFRAIRKAVAQAGFRLIDQRFHDYDALSLTQLPHILKKKKIPYCNNVNALKEIEKRAPHVFRWAEVPPLKSNYVMHESAHGVARSLQNRFFKIRKTNARQKKQELILNTLIEESFANSCECIANLYADSDFHDEFLFKNSYIMENETDRKHLRKLAKKVGHRSLFRLLLLAYLFSNFQKTRIEDDEFKRVLRFVGINEVSGVKRVFQIGLRLDPAFTMFTNAFCFRLMGVKENLRQALDFDFLAFLENDLRYQKWIAALEQIIEFD